MTGQLAFVLHAHLPFVRHPEHARFHEETWLFEAVTGCYLPLLAQMDGWSRDGLPWQMAMSLTPTLCAMLDDPVLQERYDRHIASLLELAEKELERTHLGPALNALVDFYRGRLLEAAEPGRGIRSVVDRFAAHQRAGHLEILTCAATHALLPLLVDEPSSIRAQLGIAVAAHERRFGQAPRGIWLPECGWAPELEPYLREAGLRWSVVETHGLLDATPRPRAAVFAPVITPDGLAVFGRDPASARQVWSRQGGYPGDARYREFHRDLAHEAEWDYVRPHLPTRQRTFTGFKYHRVTGADVPAADKEIYDREAALQAVRGHAAHFIGERRRQFDASGPLLGQEPLLVAPYDAELFGHWWFEGPEFLDQVVRLACGPDSELRLTAPGRYLRENPVHQRAMPAASTWGEGGHLAVWLDGSNAWMQRPLRTAAAEMTRIAGHFRDAGPDALTERFLRQAIRELLSAQASDWPFLVKTGTAGDYPADRFRRHIADFTRLARCLSAARVAHEVGLLEELEARDNLFPGLDWRIWCPRSS